MTPTDRLAHALPADPGDDGPIGIADSADLRAVLDENERLRKRPQFPSIGEFVHGADPDGGA